MVKMFPFQPQFMWTLLYRVCHKFSPPPLILAVGQPIYFILSHIITTLSGICDQKRFFKNLLYLGRKNKKNTLQYIIHWVWPKIAIFDSHWSTSGWIWMKFQEHAQLMTTSIWMNKILKNFENQTISQPKLHFPRGGVPALKWSELELVGKYFFRINMM